jgi:hypothetical protein
MSDKLCDYGCGQKSNFVFKNGKHCCSLFYRSCPFMAAKIGKTRLGKTHTEESKQKIGKKSKERLAITGSPFKGKHHTEEVKLQNSIRHKGRVGWAKGYTKDTHPGLMSALQKRTESGKCIHIGEANGMFGKTHSDEVKQQNRERNILLKRWQGEDNPWYGKDRSGGNSPRFLSKEDRTKWEKYKNRVRMLTERTYKQNKSNINPNELSRNRTDYHLDHIIPIWYGFLNNIIPEILAHIKNLRIISQTDNNSRSKTILTENEHILLQEMLCLLN